MTKFTKEFMQDIISGNGFGVAPSAVADMARQLLASMEQEPEGWQFLAVNGLWVSVTENGMRQALKDGCEVRPLYAAPQLPQPVVAITQHFDTIALDTAKMVMCDVNRRDEFLGGDIQLLSRIQCRVDEACRAAMLQAGNSQVTPDCWIPVSERMPEDDDFVYIWPRPDFGIELHVAQYGKFDKRDKGWYAQVYEHNYGIEYHPITVTHWMPLPAAPKLEDL